MGGQLGRLARHVARDEPLPATQPRMSRRRALERGVLGALMLGGLGQVVLAKSAFAAPAKCTSQRDCLEAKRLWWEDVYEDCVKKHGYFPEFGCSATKVEGVEHANRYCRAVCPPLPKRKRKRGPRNKPTSPTHAPPLPPNPYDDLVDECANCASVKGVCCFGGPDPRHLCACGTPGISCLRYGCQA